MSAYCKTAKLAPEAPANQNPVDQVGRVPAPDGTEPQTPTKPRSSSPGTKDAPADK